MQFTSHQAISLIALIIGSVLLYQGIAGFEILLLLIGITILLKGGIANRTMEIAFHLRGTKFIFRSIPDDEVDSQHRPKDESSGDQTEDRRLSESIEALEEKSQSEDFKI